MAEIVHTGGESTDSLAGKLRFNQADGEIVGVDGNIPRLLITTKDGDFSMKVSEAGVNVYEAGDDELVFNSNNNIFKIVDILEISVPAVSQVGAGSTFVSAVVPHGLSYIPMSFGFIPNGIAYIALPHIAHGYSGGIYIQTQDIYIDATNVTVLSTVSNQGGATIGTAAFTAKVYLLQETAN